MLLDKKGYKEFFKNHLIIPRLRHESAIEYYKKNRVDVIYRRFLNDTIVVFAVIELKTNEIKKDWNLVYYKTKELTLVDSNLITKWNVSSESIQLVAFTNSILWSPTTPEQYYKISRHTDNKTYKGLWIRDDYDTLNSFVFNAPAIEYIARKNGLDGDLLVGHPAVDSLLICEEKLSANLQAAIDNIYSTSKKPLTRSIFKWMDIADFFMKFIVDIVPDEDKQKILLEILRVAKTKKGLSALEKMKENLLEYLEEIK